MVDVYLGEFGGQVFGGEIEEFGFVIDVVVQDVVNIVFVYVGVDGFC